MPERVQGRIPREWPISKPDDPPLLPLYITEDEYEHLMARRRETLESLCAAMREPSGLNHPQPAGHALTCPPEGSDAEASP